MSEPITMSELSIAGFRAFLDPQSFQLRRGNRPLSLAVYAPNAKGKSSLVDAIEFFFSPDGTLKRLGVNRSGTQAGREALEHIKCAEKGIVSQITVKLATEPPLLEGTRTVERCEQCPDAATVVLAVRKLDFLIRGYELRRFVHDQTPHERYQEVSAWFGLSSLTSIEHNLRDLRLRLKSDLDKNPQGQSHARELQRITAKALTTWDRTAVLDWVNTNLLQPLDPTLQLAALDQEDPAYQTVSDRKKKEEDAIGLTALKEVSDATDVVYGQQEIDGVTSERGAIVDFESAADSEAAAAARERTALAESANAVFREVWDAASRVFEQTSVDIDTCPVCDTPLDRTAKRSREGIQVHLKDQIASLDSYNQAFTALTRARQQAGQKQASAIAALSSLTAALKTAGFSSDAESMDGYVNELRPWVVSQAVPDSAGLKRMIETLRKKLDDERKRIGQMEGDHTFAACLSTLDDLVRLRVIVDEDNRVRRNMQRILASFAELETIIGTIVRGYVQTVIDSLKDRVNVLYRAVHADESGAPAIRLDLPTDTKQPQLNLLVDFASNRAGVVPSGYLSDSQVHTLALSLRLAALQLFNRRVPLAILDDVVTSYDADHRKAIAAMLADHFADFQVILVTHDERFFAYLKDHLPPSSWVFKRIVSLEDGFGPKFHDHMVADALIEDRLANGQSAANDMRQAEEEWLLRICRDFGVEVEIRDVHKAHTYERSELAVALHKFLKSKKITVPEVSGIANPFLVSLQSGEVENFGSHFSDAPNAWGSTGDEARRWQEFKSFRGMFVCAACAHTRFKRPKGMDKPVCRKCEVPFSFTT